MAEDLLFRVWDHAYGYNAKAAIDYMIMKDAQDPRHCYLHPVIQEDDKSCIELGSPYVAERACGDDGVVVRIFEGDLIRAFVGSDDVIHKGLVGRAEDTGEWVVFDEVIRYDEHGNACVRNLETCSRLALSCLSHIQITGNIHDYKQD